MTEDGATYFRDLYVAHCAACRAAGIPEPSIDEWIERLGERIAERQEGLPRDDGTMT